MLSLTPSTPKYHKPLHLQTVFRKKIKGYRIETQKTKNANAKLRNPKLLETKVVLRTPLKSRPASYVLNAKEIVHQRKAAVHIATFHAGVLLSLVLPSCSCSVLM